VIPGSFHVRSVASCPAMRPAVTAG
jgi:hypothetical protein